MFVIRHWLLMVLPFALWGTAMAAMAPLVQSAGPEFVAISRLLPAGAVVLLGVIFLKRPLFISRIDFGWFFDGFTMNLRFGIGQKSSGIVEPFF